MTMTVFCTLVQERNSSLQRSTDRFPDLWGPPVPMEHKDFMERAR